MRLLLMILAVVLTQVGCKTTGGEGAGASAAAGRGYTKPTVAVLDFENKAGGRFRWDVGSGMRDMLVDELVKSDRYSLVARRDLGAVVREIDNRHDPRFRKEGQAEAGKLKNVKYLIKGAVTDFSVTTGGGISGVGKKLGLGARGETGSVGVTLYVIEVETGAILASESLRGKAYGGELSVRGFYDGIKLGGQTFYNTPLGRATKKVIEQAVDTVGDAIANERWYPSVVKVEATTIIISGGTDRAMRDGSVWTAYDMGEELIDPVTGDKLGREPAKAVGRAEVIAVRDKYSVARVISGSFKSGQTLRPDGERP
jgi:curli biogenesis system outer membrane secretion channel CsgG